MSVSNLFNPVSLVSVAGSLLFAVALSAGADAGESLVLESGSEKATLVELFTSQGCSSCPPAERWLGRLEDDPRLWKEIVPVAFHVDYWDYIGWRDIYAAPSHSARQRTYHNQNAIRSVYTPGFVVNGKEWRGWFRNQSLPESGGRAGQLRVEVDGTRLRATFDAGQQTEQDTVLNIALMGVGMEIDVERGENSGRRLSQDFTVLKHITIGSDRGNWETSLPDIDLPADSRRAIAVWVSGQGSQQPLQVVGGWL
ncbi:MAG: DUF1223 domain-containing protein [Candidatus Sedimenticola sp. 20ELBAFRAG]